MQSTVQHIFNLYAKGRKVKVTFFVSSSYPYFWALSVASIQLLFGRSIIANCCPFRFFSSWLHFLCVFFSLSNSKLMLITIICLTFRHSVHWPLLFWFVSLVRQWALASSDGWMVGYSAWSTFTHSWNSIISLIWRHYRALSHKRCLSFYVYFQVESLALSFPPHSNHHHRLFFYLMLYLVWSTQSRNVTFTAGLVTTCRYLINRLERGE